jgi:drug/metabolite transporter (DMT)-like permease
MNLIPPVCAFGSAAVWAFASIGYSEISKEHSVFKLNFMRAFVALPFFIFSAIVFSGGVYEAIAQFKSLDPACVGWLGLAILGSFGLGDSIFLMSTKYLGVPSALAIAACFPIWTLAVGVVFLGEPFTWAHFFGVLVTIVGLLIVILNSPVPEGQGMVASQKSRVRMGVLLAFCTSTLWALNSVATVKSGTEVMPAVSLTVRMCFAILMTVTFNRFYAPGTSIFMPLLVWRKFLWVFVIEGFIGSFLYLYGVSRSPLAVGSTLSSLAPVVSVPFAVLLGVERFSIYRTMGVCLAVIGVSLLVSF